MPAAARGRQSTAARPQNAERGRATLGAVDVSSSGSVPSGGSQCVTVELISLH